MKKVYLFVLGCLVFSSSTLAQNCRCEEELDFVTTYYENNLPGFSDHVTPVNRKEYDIWKEELRIKSQRYCEEETGCFKVLITYVEFFKDNHSSLYQASTVYVNEKDPDAVKEFKLSSVFTQTEQIDISSISSPSDKMGLENVYISNDSVYTVRIVKSKTDFRDYAGVIIGSRTSLWEPGQVKFELKKTGDNTFDMFVYMRNHSIRYYKNVVLRDGRLGDDWYNESLPAHQAYNTALPFVLEYKQLDKQTSYIHIPTFSAYWYAKLDSFYTRYDKKIRSTPYLIIDVRNNGGGSDACVSPLLPYIYTKPFYSDTVGVYVTPENIRKLLDWYEEDKNDTINFSKDYLKESLDEVERMKQAPFQSFIPRSSGELISLDKVLPKPLKVAIIMNKHSASSCETLLFWAMESDKTILVGENSGGYVGYGEITEVPTPQFGFRLGCTLTRYTNQRKYEVTGIPPDYYLNNESDWIDQTLRLLKQ